MKQSKEEEKHWKQLLNKSEIRMSRDAKNQTQ